jgi:hypothetical protein
MMVYPLTPTLSREKDRMKGISHLTPDPLSRWEREFMGQQWAFVV